MKKIFFITCVLLVQSYNLFAKEYTSVEDIFNDNSFNISKMGYPGDKEGCQEFINSWIGKLTNYIDSEPTDARAYLYRGYFYGFKPTCWKRTDKIMKSQGRDEYLESNFIKSTNEKMNSDWRYSLVINKESTDKEKKLSWFMLDRVFSVFMDPEVLELKEKQRIEIATPQNLGEGTEHPIDKSTFILKQYERMADKYNDADDRENVSRILNELSQILPDGAVKAGELMPLYEKAWVERDQKIASHKKDTVIENTLIANPVQPKAQTPTVKPTPVQGPKPTTPKVVPAPENTDNRLWYIALGLLILLAVGGVLIRSRR